MTDEKNKYKNHYLDARLLAGSSASRDTKGEKDEYSHNARNQESRADDEYGAQEVLDEMQPY